MKRTIGITALIAAGFVLTACGQDLTPTAAPAPVTVSVTKTPAPVTVSVTATATKTVTETETVTATPEVETLNVHGDIDLTGADNWTKDGSGCVGDGGYDDLHEGATVKISAGNGDVLGLTGLLTGKIDGSTCTFGFVADVDVPAGGVTLVLAEVTHRGQLEAHDEGNGEFYMSGSIGD